MSIESAHYINVILGIGTILLQVLTLGTLLLLIFKKENKFLSFVKKYFIEIGFLLSFSGVLISSFYSEVLNYLPCFHCWIQRIFMFPQAILFGVAWLKRDRNVFWYSLPLTLLGLADAIYLIYIYYFNINAAPCDASGVSCAVHYVYEFGGYISIPSISITGFVAMLSLLAVVYFYKKEE